MKDELHFHFVPQLMHFFHVCKQQLSIIVDNDNDCQVQMSVFDSH